MDIRIITDDEVKKNVTRTILEALTEWFEIEESREDYIRNSSGKTFIGAYDDDRPIGFMYLKQTGRHTVEIAVMGVLKEYHRSGVGRRLFEAGKNAAVSAGYSFIQVKTVKMGVYEDYDRTNLFYLSLGFKELEVFPNLWDEANPCQIYIMAL